MTTTCIYGVGGGLLSQSNYLIMEASAPSACAIMIFHVFLTSCQVSSVTTRKRWTLA